MRRILVFSIVASIAAGLFVGSTGGTRAAVADNEQQLTEFVPGFDSDSCAGSPVMTHPETGKTLIAFIQPDDGEPLGGMLVVGLLDVDGALDSELVEVSTTFASNGVDNCDPPSLAVGPDGTWLVVWPLDSDGNGTDAAEYDGSVFGQVISSTGTLSGANFEITDDYDYNIETASAVWSADDERYLVTWKANVDQRDADLFESNRQQIVGQFINASGGAIDSNFLVTNYANGVDNNQDLAFGNGIWINVHSKGGSRPYGQIISATGLQGEPFALYFDDQDYQGPGIVYNQFTEQFAVSFWESVDEDTKRLRLLNNEGTPIGTETIFVYAGTRPRLAVNGDAGYLMTWSMYEADSSGIRAQMFDATLQVVGETVQISSAGLNAWRSEATCSTDGDIILAYWGYVDADNAMNVYTNTIAASCELGGGEDPSISAIGRTRLVGSTTEFADDRVRWAWLRCTRDGDAGTSSRLPIGCRIAARGAGLGSSLERRAYRLSAADRRSRYMRVAIYADGEWHYSSAVSVR
jgi:hypothetical protein